MVSVRACYALVVLAGCAGSLGSISETGEVVCPEGTRLKTDNSVMPLEQWCERPDGTPHGPLVAHYENGRLKETGAYRDGRRDGRWTYWGPDGTLAAELRYKRGKPHGTWTSWYAEGHKWQQQAYRNGERHGLWIEWWESGAKRKQRAYRGGLPDGQFEWWNDDGQLVRVERYTKGELVETVKYVSGVRVVERRSSSSQRR